MGKEIRLKRLFSRGNPVVVAIDHGQTYGPIEGLMDVPATVRAIGGADGILMTPFVLGRVKDAFTRKDGPSLILRLNWTTALCHPWEYRQAHTRPLLDPEEALYLGADAALANLTLQAGDERVDAENVKIFTDLAKKKERAGIPLIAEVLPLIPVSETRRLHAHVRTVVRIAWELGADMIKTFYTGEAFAEVVAAAPIPVFVLGGEKMKSEEDALEVARLGRAAGAAGVVFGRNAFQAKDPAAFIERLKTVVKAGPGRP